MLEVHNHSSYPKIGDFPKQQVLRKAYHMYDNGKISIDELRKIENKYVKEVILEQLKYVDVPTDGQIRWYDPISHIPKKLGIKLGQLMRFFDTNFYYRQPIFDNLDFSPKNGFLIDEYNFAKKISQKIKVVVTGLYTITKMSIVKVDREKLVLKLMDIYKSELLKFKENGYPLIQLEQPAILYHKEDIKRFKEVVKEVIKGYEKLLLVTYFGDATDFIEHFYEITNYVGFDFTYSKNILKKLSVFKNKKVLLGIVDGRNTKLENPSDVAKVVEKFMKYAEVSITTSCGLEYLPRAIAMKKLEILKKVKKLING